MIVGNKTQLHRSFGGYQKFISFSLPIWFSGLRINFSSGFILSKPAKESEDAAAYQDANDDRD